MGDSTRRDFTAGVAAGSAALATHPAVAQEAPPGRGKAQEITGRLSGKKLVVPDVNVPPMPALTTPGVILNGKRVEGFGIDPSRGYPDARSHRRKFGLLVPATNTSMEHDLWGLVFRNQGATGLRGVGLHTTPVLTPSPKLATAADLAAYRAQFLDGVRAAVTAALLAQPQYLIMGMSLEHILTGAEAVRAEMAGIAKLAGDLGWATWHDAAAAALGKFKAKRFGLLTPFDRAGNVNAARLFSDLGFEVAATVGFSCANALHIAHVPDWAKEKAIIELLATPANRLDAVVQCGTNLSLAGVCERVEPVIGVPVLGINAVTFWYALRENGIEGPLDGGGRLLREF